MASVPNMRPTAAPAAGDGKAPAEGEGVKAPFASLLATGTPSPAVEGDAPARGPLADLLAALQQALAGRAAPAKGEAAPKDGDGKARADDTSDGDDDGSDDAAATDGAASPADLLPLIEAQSAAPVAVTPAPAPKPDAKAGPTIAEAVSLRVPARPAMAPAAPRPVAGDRHDPAGAEAPVQAEIAAVSSGDAKPAPKAKADAKAPPADRIGKDAKAGTAAPRAAPARPAPAPAPAAPALAPTAPAPADPPRSAPTAAQSAAAPDPLAAMQAALAAVADRPAPAGSADPRPAVPEAPVADRAMAHQLDLARDSVWLDRLARDIATSADSDGPMRFKLHPETLGQMRVELAQGERGASVRLTVETETARDIVTDAQPRLVAEARAQGVRIAETHVDLAGGSGGHASSDPRRQDAAREPVFIRTTPGTGRTEAEDQPRRGRAERYA